MSETFHYFVTIGRPNATRTLTLVWNFLGREGHVPGKDLKIDITKN